MSKYVRRSSYSKACKKAKSFGHYKTGFNVGKHMRVTVGTKGIHTSFKVGNVTYKPQSGNYSVRGKYGTYYGNVNNSNNYHSNNSYSCDPLDVWKYWVAAFIITIVGFISIVGYSIFTTEYKYNDEFKSTVDHYVNSITYGKERTEQVEQLVYERKVELGFYEPIPVIEAIALYDVECSTRKDHKCIEAGETYFIKDVIGDINSPGEFFYEISYGCRYDIYSENCFEILE